MEHKWSQRQTKAIKDSIKHWHENLMILQLNYLADDPLMREISIGGQNCSLCNFNYIKNDSCESCPLSIIGQDCGAMGSAWSTISYQMRGSESISIGLYYNKLFKSFANMINVLESLLN